MADKPILNVLKGEALDPPPIWFMRQAGRYLPEYRALRADRGGFLDLVYDSEAAAEVTLQPLRRYGFDAAILFSDILIVPHAMGQHLRFLAGEGPDLSPRLAVADLASLTPAHHHFDPIYETVRRVAADLPQHATLIGFAGSPWTVATYMVNGSGSKEQAEARLMAYRERGRFAALIDAISDLTVEYLCGQIEAGAEVVQLFDSWSGSLAPEEFFRWCITPTRRIVDAVRARHPDTPIIGFPKGAGGKLLRYARETGVDAIGIDESVDPAWAHEILPAGLPVQGNLDPMVLLTGGKALTDAVAAIRAALKGRPHIFNLGHGISKETPLAHVDEALAAIRA
ncbi:uroporphyrinogen decarboxylase [Pacificimonas sp. WHA3]|uniref:Uroporphyrinogen decarboxylase n=1 Tax=Pacificimonas pallii TaxID=2827236 RepID=A0ABS6SBQ4_9SPHN|nr:uroporphyrinogen decarboxylase [Pacificimonas pallii]MBV7255756.1 uroporphyrinogen decarboxylase [Pacificimonas pallii]